MGNAFGMDNNGFNIYDPNELKKELDRLLVEMQAYHAEAEEITYEIEKVQKSLEYIVNLYEQLRLEGSIDLELAASIRAQTEFVYKLKGLLRASNRDYHKCSIRYRWLRTNGHNLDFG